jgi:hypothetical protein
METSFGLDSKQEIFKGALLYKLQRKHAARTDRQPNNSVASIEDTTTNMYLLVFWNIGGYFNTFRVCPIECTDDFTWDEDKLWVLCHQYKDQLLKDYKSRTITWLTHSGSIMKIRRDIIFRSDYKLDIVISEGIAEYSIEKPMKIDQKRLV